MISADIISYQACNMLNKNPQNIEGSFTMYSYGRFSNLIIHGIAQQMIDEGCSESQIKEVLSSKLVRWGLDSDEDIFIEYGKQFARKHKFSEQYMDDEK